MSSEIEKPEVQKKRINFKKIVFFVILFLGFMVFLPGISLVLFIGFLPTLGAMISDPTETRAQTFCVGVCNMAGLIPMLHELYLNKFKAQTAYTVIHSEINLLIILCAAAIGWCLFFIVPPITVTFYKRRDWSTILKMVRRYNELKETWGDSVTSSSVIEELKNKTQK